MPAENIFIVDFAKVNIGCILGIFTTAQTIFMIWQAIKDGFYLLTYWEVWFGALGFAIALFALQIMVASFTISKTESFSGTASGCLARFISLPVIQGILVAILIVILLPMIFGNSDFLDFNFIVDNWWTILKAGIASILLILILGFIPIVGGVILDISSTTFFVQGLIILGVIIKAAPTDLLIGTFNYTNMYPSFWAIIGFGVYSVVISFLSSFVLTGIMGLLGKGEQDAALPFVAITISFTAVMVGIISLASYISYITLSQGL